MLSTALSVAMLGAAADVEIVKVLTHGGHFTRRPTGEVGAIASITLDGTPAIASAWRALLPTVHLSFIGVFCHGSPQVNLATSPKLSHRCELADLLLVVDETDGAGNVIDRRANLVQAKLLSKGAVTVDPVQDHLLNCWPSFTFVSTAYRSHARNFWPPPTGKDSSSRYGAVHLGSGTRSWDQNPPFSPSSSGVSLGNFLAGMLLGSPRCGREVIIAGIDDWSETIGELLTVTYAQTFRHGSLTASGGTSPRGVMALVEDYQDDSGVLLRSFSHWHIHGPPPEWEASGNGISILQISARSEDGPWR